MKKTCLRHCKDSIDLSLSRSIGPEFPGGNMDYVDLDW